jgi:putative NIF3 family GTP cyclohydrolase 1 type 2
MRGTDLIELLGSRYDLSVATVVGSLNRKFSAVIVAAGAYGVNAFRDPDTLVVTGEFKHHDALQLQRRGVTAIHLGHGESERPALRRVRDWLRRDLAGLQVQIARSDRGPFRRLV